MNILISIETLATGGAEAFSLRLAQALSSKHTVFLYRFYKDYIDQDLINQLAPDVQLLSFDVAWDVFIRKIDSLLIKVKIDFSLRSYLLKRDLRQVIAIKSIQVIHSNQFKVDYITTKVAGELQIPVITTIHGDYVKFWHQTPDSILNYRQKLVQCIALTNTVVCISDAQLTFFRTKVQSLVRNKIDLVKIYNGYPFHPSLLDASLSNLGTLNIPADHFVFGMVARGIPEKGWEFAIKAFILLQKGKCSLVLVGDSPFIKELKIKYKDNKDIYFVGYAVNPIAWIKVMHVGLLPSIYGSESLPTVIIEYLICGKPVIASDIGEIANMLRVSDSKTAGLIIPIKQGEVPVNLLLEAMKRYLQDSDLYQEHGRNTRSAAAKFDMQNCINLYTQLYEKHLKQCH